MILIICNTPYQVFNAINMKIQKYTEEDVDIILSNHSNIQKLQQRLCTLGIFNNVYLSTSLRLARDFFFFEDDKKLRVLLYPEEILKSCLDIDYLKYSIVYTANVDGYINLIYRLHCKNKTNCEFWYYEDGWTTYTNDWSVFAYSQFEKYFYEVLGEQILIKNIRNIYVYEPDLGCFPEKFTYKELPKIQYNNMQLKEIYNFVFDYKNTKEYSCFAIFLEEAFEQDGYKNNDVDLVKEVSKCVGPDNILVKRHPRLEKNRFKDLGIHTNVDFSIPWEVIIMNNDFSEKILFTVSSGAVLTPRLVFGEPVFTVFMRDLLQGTLSRMYKTKEFRKFIGMFRKKYPNELYLPKTNKGIDICIRAILDEMQVHERHYRGV